MSHLKLLKLMYIAERRALLGWGRSITYDSFASMRLGPILSGTYDLIGLECPPPGWPLFRQRVARLGPYRVKLTQRNTPEHSPLSDAEIDLVAEVYQKYGKMDRFELCKLTHEFPEWQDPSGSSLPISIKAILERNGVSETEVDIILSEIGALAHAESVFA